MKRIFHPFWVWEDYQNGMYDLEREYTEKEEEELANKVKLFLSSDEFFNIGLIVITQWKYASEHNLTNNHRNKQAWIGQASCCFKLNVPERITKHGWKLLTLKEQKKANKVADDIIKNYGEKYVKEISKEKCLGSY